MGKSETHQGLQARLGTKAKSASTCQTSIRSKRTERYQLTRTARAIYAKQGQVDGLPYALNYHRTAKCAYVAYASAVHVNVAYEHNKAFLSGVTACGSVHTCPICSSKIEERRRAEIAKAVDYWYSLPNKTVSMVTLTFSHSIGDTLGSVLERQADALRRLRSGAVWNNFKAVFGFDSLIRSLEITWGETNGWHPHTHELWCIDKQVDEVRLAAYLKARFKAAKHADKLARLLASKPQAVFEELLLERWEACCERAGLMVKADGSAVCRSAFRAHAVDVKHGVSVGDYLAKQDDSRHWGVDREMAKGSTKQGRKKGMHPFGFLAEFATTGNGAWARRWLDYSRDIDGKRRLYWTAGLKDRVGLDELTDEELAARDDDRAYIVYEMTKPEWHKARHNVPAVLDAAEDGENISNLICNMPQLNVFGANIDLPPSLDPVNQSSRAGAAAKDFAVQLELERRPPPARERTLFEIWLEKQPPQPTPDQAEIEAWLSDASWYW